MSTLDQKLPFNVNEKFVPTVLQGSQGSADLVAIHNMVAIKYGSSFGEPGALKEKSIKSVLNDMLQKCIERVEGISAAEAKEVKHVLANIGTKFSSQPRLSGHMDFVNNVSYLLCRLLDLTVLHGWVLSPEVSSYDSLREFSRSELVDYSFDLKGKGGHLTVCPSLLDDSSTQLTSYGFNSLSAELNDDAVALVFCRNRLDIIHTHKDALFIYVSDADIRKQMPQAVWMLFEERKESNIYFTEMYTPVREQVHKEKAREWYMRFLETQRKSDQLKEDKGKEKNKSSQQAQSDDAAPESFEPSVATGKHGEDSLQIRCPEMMVIKGQKQWAPITVKEARHTKLKEK